MAQRVVRTGASLILGVGALFAAPAAGQEIDLEIIYALSGSCERLVTPGVDRSAGCREPMLHLIYRSGRGSFAFSDGNVALVSFSGTDAEMDDERGTLTLDLITIASDGGARVEGAAATGTCSFDNPFLGRASIRCDGRTEAGAFSASFTSDGSPPTRHAMGAD